MNTKRSEFSGLWAIALLSMSWSGLAAAQQADETRTFASTKSSKHRFLDFACSDASDSALESALSDCNLNGFATCTKASESKVSSKKGRDSSCTMKVTVLGLKNTFVRYSAWKSIPVIPGLPPVLQGLIKELPNLPIVNRIKKEAEQRALSDCESVKGVRCRLAGPTTTEIVADSFRAKASARPQ